MRRFWTPAEVALLGAMYPHCHTADVAAWLGKSLPSTYNAAFQAGLKKTAEYLASDAAARKIAQHPNSIACQLKPGHNTWNKGLKGVNGQSKTRFKHGSRSGIALTRYHPIGGTTVWDGYLFRKMAETGKKTTDWRPAHAVVWIEAHGPIPAGHVVVFKAGQRTADPALLTIDRLECIDRAELARRNHPIQRSPELARLFQLKGAITRQVNRLAREAQERT